MIHMILGVLAVLLLRSNRRTQRSRNRTLVAEREAWFSCGGYSHAPSAVHFVEAHCPPKLQTSPFAPKQIFCGAHLLLRHLEGSPPGQ
jgi:hypothetical protein